jgi:hypothetical protein
LRVGNGTSSNYRKKVWFSLYFHPQLTAIPGSGYGGIRRRAWGKVHMLRSGKRGDLAPLDDLNDLHEFPTSSSSSFAPGGDSPASTNNQYSALMEAGLWALQRNLVLCIPRKGFAQPQSQFFHIHVYVNDLYNPTFGPPVFLQQNRQTDQGNI